MLKGMAKHPDLSMRYLVFFYELCKMGVVVFDLNKLEQLYKHQHTVDEQLKILRSEVSNELVGNFFENLGIHLNEVNTVVVEEEN